MPYWSTNIFVRGVRANKRDGTIPVWMVPPGSHHCGTAPTLLYHTRGTVQYSTVLYCPALFHTARHYRLYWTLVSVDMAVL